MQQENKRFFNCHAHCFKDDHVPEYFLTKWLPVSKLLSNRWFIGFLHRSAFSGDLGFFGNLIVKILHIFDKNITKEGLIRYMNFFVYSNVKNQTDVVEEMRKYYPRTTGLVMLSMDLEYMGAGKPKIPLEGQLIELASVKKEMPAIIYPFVHCDPRRIYPTHEREKSLKNTFAGNAFLVAAVRYLTDRI